MGTGGTLYPNLTPRDVESRLPRQGAPVPGMTVDKTLPMAYLHAAMPRLAKVHLEPTAGVEPATC